MKIMKTATFQFNRQSIEVFHSDFNSNGKEVVVFFSAEDVCNAIKNPKVSARIRRTTLMFPRTNMAGQKYQTSITPSQVLISLNRGNSDHDLFDTIEKILDQILLEYFEIAQAYDRQHP